MPKSSTEMWCRTLRLLTLVTRYRCTVQDKRGAWTINVSIAGGSCESHLRHMGVYNKLSGGTSHEKGEYMEEYSVNLNREVEKKVVTDMDERKKQKTSNRESHINYEIVGWQRFTNPHTEILHLQLWYDVPAQNNCPPPELPNHISFLQL